MESNDTWRQQAERWMQYEGAVSSARDAEKALKAMVPLDAKLCYGCGVTILRNRAGALSLRRQGAK
jgi:hypothetical protein